MEAMNLKPCFSQKFSLMPWHELLVCFMATWSMSSLSALSLYSPILAGRGGDGGGSRAQAIALTPGHHRRGGEGLHTEGPAAPRPSAWPPGHHHARVHHSCSALASPRHYRSVRRPGSGAAAPSSNPRPAALME